jgi:mRNA interferase MazF
MSIKGEVARGSIVWLRLLPRVGNEQAGYRAVLVLSDGIIRSSVNSQLAFIVPITTKVKGIPFEVPVPNGDHAIALNGTLVNHPEMAVLEGVVLTDHARSVDLNARDAIVIGQVDPLSVFYKQVVDYVKAILA